MTNKDLPSSWTLKAAIGLVISFIVINVLIGVLWHIARVDTITLKAIIGSYLIQLTLMTCSLWWFSIRTTQFRKRYFQWQWQSASKTIGYVLAAYVINMGIQLFFVLLQNSASIEFPGFDRQASHIELFGHSSAGIAVLVFIALTIAPIVEESTFRGFLLRVFAGRWGTAWGIVISALIFAFAHFEFQSFFPLFILGCVMGGLFVRSRSLPTVILFHAWNNLIALAVEWYLLNNPL